MWQFPRRETLRSSVMMNEAVQTHAENVRVNENALSNAAVWGGGTFLYQYNGYAETI